MKKTAGKVKVGDYAQVPQEEGVVWITVEEVTPTTDFEENPMTKIDGVTDTDVPVSWFGSPDHELEVRKN